MLPGGAFFGTDLDGARSGCWQRARTGLLPGLLPWHLGRCSV